MLRIGDNVQYEARPYVVIGFTPMSVEPARVELEAAETSERRLVELTDPRLAAPMLDRGGQILAFSS